MKKMLTLAAILVMSCNAMAEKGGFKGGDAPPPPHKQDAGYKGSEDTNEGKSSDVRSLRDGAWVTLEGNIIKKTGKDRYDFRDKSGVIEVIIPQAAWKGKERGADDLLRISGYVKGQGKTRHVDVQRLDEP
ncbi:MULTISPECIES: NirD/YgiW/YdeI family stress tolerance protein [Erwinia]|uniref:YgiW/YdeI family stress tolerance OB fold protein n=1 Tax=Erwinia TaxID=551 RepID=UPI00054E82BF|nr:MULTISPECIES: NirD/YgiW/YdeI family stress tolerance protein [Erwinia]